MSIIIKFLICFMLSIGSVKIVKNSSIKRKKGVTYICSLFSVILFITLVFVPIEEFFYQFETLEEAYEYKNPDAEIRLIIEGKESAFVSGDENGKETIMFVPKVNEVWKTGTGLEAKVITKCINKVVIEIYQYQDSSDFYAIVYELHGREIDIKDSNNSKYISLKKKRESGAIFTKYYACISNYDENYWITVDGEQIELR